MMGTYYKIARPDGYDIYTGQTINYRAALMSGQPVRPPAQGEPILCSPTVIHASEIAEQCFQGGRVPCSLYRVEGTPVVSDNTKHGFQELRVIEELNPASHFNWRYAEAASPLKPLALIPSVVTPDVLSLLRDWASVRASVWYSVRASVRDSVGTSVWDSVWDSAWASVGALVRDSAWASVRDSAWASVGASVGDSVWAYVGYIFAPVVTQWSKDYPFQACVDLWRLGLMPSYDGKLWRLHGHSNARILWEGAAP